MTDPRSNNELNRIIAEWCGWKFVPSRDIYICGQLQAVPEEWVDPGSESYNAPPNYCRDLNACHEVDSRLDYVMQHAYAEYLFNLVGGYEDWYAGITFTEAMKLTFATARQRAEALVKVIEQQKGQK